jgi:hypothetical protein
MPIFPVCIPVFGLRADNFPEKMGGYSQRNPLIDYGGVLMAEVHDGCAAPNALDPQVLKAVDLGGDVRI